MGQAFRIHQCRAMQGESWTCLPGEIAHPVSSHNSHPQSSSILFSWTLHNRCVFQHTCDFTVPSFFYLRSLLLSMCPLYFNQTPQSQHHLSLGILLDKKVITHKDTCWEAGAQPQMVLWSRGRSQGPLSLRRFWSF